MGVLAGVGSLGALSLFLAWFLRRSSAVTPLVAVALAMVYFSLCGMGGQLAAGAVVWYVACGLLLVVALWASRRQVGQLFSGGWWFFMGMALAMWVYLAATQPMLTHWDEFTFWGAAGKVTSNTHQLYTTARSSLIARSYPPGLIVFSYMVQFFGGYSEPGFILSFFVVYLACMAAGSGLWKKNKTATVLLLAGLFCVPLLFAVDVPAGQMHWTYLVCMADLPLALLFGGALGLYFAGGEKGGRLLVPFGVVLAAMTLVKDMGFALALVALFVVLLDLLFCERERLGLWRLRRWGALAAMAGYGLLMTAGPFLLWARYFEAASGEDRLNFATHGASLSPLELLLTGAQMLVGVGRSQQFSTVLAKMGAALFTRPVSLLGPGMAVLAVILLISALAFVLSATRRQRRRVLVFTLGMALGFAAFYIFNIFTYALVFKAQEATDLKDYARYISPYWLAWLVGALVLLSRAATGPRASFYRLRVARAAQGAVAGCLVLAVLVLGNWQGNFLRVSPSQYGVRCDVRAVVDEAVAQGMAAQDVVYIISQGDDGTRFYMLGYEMPAVRTPLFNGYKQQLSGAPMLDEAGMPIMHGNAASTLVAPGTEALPPYGAETTRAELQAFLRLYGCTHLLLDVPDDFVLTHLRPLFRDGLAGWDVEDPFTSGHRYYRIEWNDKGRCTFVPVLAGQAGGGAP